MNTRRNSSGGSEGYCNEARFEHLFQFCVARKGEVHAISGMPWSSARPEPSFLLSVMLTDEMPCGDNETGYANPEYDALFARQATELDDEERRGIIWQIQNIVHDDVASIIPFHQKLVQAYRTDTFRGWLTNSGNLDLSAPSSLGIIEPITQK